MIIDGIEYESESSYIDAETGKPVCYAKNVPDLLRGDIRISPMRKRYAQLLDQMTHVDRAARGRLAWNTWVIAFSSRWVLLDDHGDHIFCRMAGYSDKIEINFQDSQKINKDGNYKLPEIDFGGFIFPCRVSFSRAVFEDGALFDHASFHGEVSFEKAQVCQYVTFDSAVFWSVVFFTNLDIVFGISFDSVVFNQLANFDDTKFSDFINFRRTRFVEVADFSRVEFLEHASFNEAIFFDRVIMQDCLFHGGADFHKCQFWSEVDFLNATFKRYCNFDFSHFGKPIGTPMPTGFRYCDYENKLQRHFYLTDTKNKTPPDFRGTNFSIVPNLGSTTVLTPQFLSWLERFFANDGLNISQRRVQGKNIASIYRRLGELAAAGHHHLAEKRFFRAELLARRGDEAKTWRENTMINAFELFSKCGLSFWRPMIALGIVIIASASFYYSQINWPASYSGVFELTSYSIANSLPLIGYISDSYSVSVDVLFGGIDKVPWQVRVWAFIQNAVSAILIFFGLLAIRNYFKLG